MDRKMQHAEGKDTLTVNRMSCSAVNPLAIHHLDSIQSPTIDSCCHWFLDVMQVDDETKTASFYTYGRVRIRVFLPIPALIQLIHWVRSMLPPYIFCSSQSGQSHAGQSHTFLDSPIDEHFHLPEPRYFCAISSTSYFISSRVST